MNISIDEKQLHQLISDKNRLQDKVTEMQHACNQELERRRSAELTIKDLENIIERARAAESIKLKPKAVMGRMSRILSEIDNL
jgi:hypothetical protein